MKSEKTPFKRPKDAMMTTEQGKICTTNIDSKEWVQMMRNFEGRRELIVSKN